MESTSKYKCEEKKPSPIPVCAGVIACPLASLYVHEYTHRSPLPCSIGKHDHFVDLF